MRSWRLMEFDTKLFQRCMSTRIFPIMCSKTIRLFSSMKNFIQCIKMAVSTKGVKNTIYNIYNNTIYTENVLENYKVIITHTYHQQYIRQSSITRDNSALSF